MANKSIKAAFERMWQHITASFATKEYVNNTVAGGVEGGLPVRAITFTDRPTAYAWLQNNIGKVIKMSLMCNLFSEPIVYNGAFARVGVISGARSYVFNSIQTTDITSTKLNLDVLVAIVDETETLATLSGGTAALTHEQVVDVYGEDMQVIPDEYWSEMEISATIYYIG